MTKISLNEWYSGKFWAKRKKIKDDYRWLIKSQCKDVFPKDKEYEVDYEFGFKKNPLDASNTIAMAKMIEDIIFESDGFKIVKKITLSSFKSKENYVRIIINEL